MFDALAFDQLLGTPDSGSRLRWAQARRCACLDPDGGNNISCPVCSGAGYIWDVWSHIFRAGVTGLSGRQIENLSQRLGPAAVGDATISLPHSCPPYHTVTQRDRFVALDATDTTEWSLVPGVVVTLPYMAVLTEARTMSTDGLSIIPAPVPVADANSRISVTQTTVVRVKAPRRYEVISDLTQTRAIMPKLPRKLMVKQVDLSLR